MDFMDLVKEYGLITAIAVVLHIPMYGYVWKHRKDIESIPDLKEGIEGIHLTCHIPQGAVTSLQEEVHKLKTVDTKMDGKIGAIENSLDKMDKKLDQLITLHLKG